MNLLVVRKTIDRYLKNEAHPNEQQLLETWVDQLAEQETTTQVPSEQASEQVRQRLLAKIRQQTQPRVLPLRNWLRVAAVLVPVCVASVALWVFLNKPVAWQTFRTAIGETRTLTLPDGSTVLLKPNSVCSYPEKFASGREVNLQGVAFFEVKRNPAKPFVVHAKKVRVEVLGTSFEVAAWQKLPQLSVTVRTGKVRVTTPQRQLAVLLPTQKLQYQTTSGQTELDTMGSSKELTQTEMLLFERVSLEEMLATLESYYPIQFHIQTHAPVKLSGSFGRHMTTEQITGALNLLLERYHLQIVRQKAGYYLVH